MFKIKQFIFSPFAENTYIIYDDSNKEAAVIDPGCYTREEEELLSKFAEEKQLEIKYLINTHCHIDHIFGNKFIKDKYNATFIVPEKDIFLLKLMEEQAAGYGVELKPSPQPDLLIENLNELKIGNYKCEFLFTPGHTPGEYCLYFPSEKILFSGDVLFYQSIGRTDLWGGDYDTLIRSIETKLYSLPDEVTVYPGHERMTTIGFEKKNNPFVSQ